EHHTFDVERLEPRWVLAGVSVPGSIANLETTQTLFPDGTSQIPFTESSLTSQSLYRFSADSDDYFSKLAVELVPEGGATALDAAIALYDNDGNLLIAADEDLTGDLLSERLEAEIVRGKTYTLGVFFELPSEFRASTLVVTLSGETNQSISIDPVSGAGSFAPTVAADFLSSPRDANFFPLDLLNVDDQASFTVQSANPIIGQLWSRTGDEPWQIVDSSTNGSGQFLELTINSDASKTLSESQHILAIAPNDFNNTPTLYEVSLQGNLVGPGELATPVTSAIDLASPKPDSPGIAIAQYSGNWTAPEVLRYVAPSNGPVQLTVAGEFDAVTSVFQSDGGLLTVASGNESTFEAAAGSEYWIRVDSQSGSGNFQIALEATYQAATLPLTNKVGLASGLTIGSVVPAHYFRVSPADSSVMVIKATSTSTDPIEVSVVSDSLAAVHQVEPNGQELFLPLLTPDGQGPFDIYLAGSGPTATANLQVGFVDIPSTISPASLTEIPLAASGDLTANLMLGDFGDSDGVKHVELPRDGQGNTFSAFAMPSSGSSSPIPALALYTQTGSVFSLRDIVTPDQNGVASLTTPTNLRQRVEHAMVAINLNFDSTGEVVLQQDGQPLAYVGVQMVPDLQDPAPPPHRSILSIRDVALESELSRGLWKTNLPFNFLNNSTVPTATFSPSSAEMQAELKVFLDPTAAPINTVAINGNDVLFPLNAASSQLKGESIYFSVEALPGGLGDGIYTLEMVVNTTDPTPYEVSEEQWKFQGSSLAIPNELPVCAVGTSPHFCESVVDIVQDIE
ncbi:MAG: hypothetical protein AAF497_18530, partial [Planctomycetota bacterium]